MNTKIFFFAALTALLVSCNRLPDKVDFGESVVLLNGKKVSYEPSFLLIRVHQLMSFGFVKSKKDIVNVLGFVWLPISTGDFGLLTNDSLYIGAQTAFNQTVDEDLVGYEYELVDQEDGFFNIETLDTVKQEVSGHFRAAFRRTTKNGYDDLGLPENLLFEGTFNEKYEVK